MTTANPDPILHPLVIINRLPTPNTLQDLEQHWLPETKATLLGWLNDATARAQEETARHQIHQYTEAAAVAWQKLEPDADLETGVLPSNDAVRQDPAMEQLFLKTPRTFEELRWAQAAWEDHLFFQNPWNRRVRKPKKKNEIGDGITPPNKKESGAGITPSTQEESSTEALCKSWMYDIIALYNRLGLGDRQNVPDLVGPNFAHRYSQPIRGTTQVKTKRSRRRHDYLQSKFVTAKRTIPNLAQGVPANTTDTLDESSQNSSEVEGEESEERTAWKLDEAAFAQEKNRRDGKYLEDPKTKALLPNEHVPHHGVLETSFDWPTSFDAKEWGETIAVTAKKRRYVYETEQYQDDNGHMKRRHKKNADGYHIRFRETCGYRRAGQTKQVESFIHNLNQNGSVHGRNKDGIWGGQPGQKNIMEYELEDGTRSPDLRYRTQNKFKVIKVQAPWPIVTRYERHVRASKKLKARAAADPLDSPGSSDSDADDHPLHQLSDAELEDCTKSNQNYGHSGNVLARGASNKTTLEVDDDEDCESDHDGDAFRRSYLENVRSAGSNT